MGYDWKMAVICKGSFMNLAYPLTLLLLVLTAFHKKPCTLTIFGSQKAYISKDKGMYNVKYTPPINIEISDWVVAAFVLFFPVVIAMVVIAI